MPIIRFQAALPSARDPFCYQRGRLVSIAQAEPGAGFARDASWRPTDGKATRKGFVDVPMLVAEQPGATCELSFQGSAIGLLVAAGPDAGVIEWSVDGAEFQRCDLRTRWSGQLHLPWAYVLADELSAGAHRLRIRVVARGDSGDSGESGNRDGKTAVRIAHFLAN